MVKAVHMRLGVIAAAGIVVIAAAVHFGERSGEFGSAERASRAKPDAAQPGAEPKTASLAELIGAPRRPLLGEAQGDLFASPRPVPAPDRTIPAVAAQPSVPSFPYRYGGWLDSGSGASHVFVREGIELVGIKAGDMLDDAWRLDAVSEDRIEVSFVPGGQQLSMSLASLIGETTGHGAMSAPAVASASRAPLTALPQPAGAPAAAQSPTGTAPLVVGGAIGLPSAAAPARPSHRAGVAPAASSAAMPSQDASAAAMPSQNASAGPGISSTLPTGKLGVDAPGSGSMPTGPAQAGTSMQIGPASSASMPTSPAPTGKLGL